MCDGYTSASILWLYIKSIFSNARLDFTVHTHKEHGLEDKVEWILNENKWDLILVPDAGSFDGQEMRRLAAEGIDVLVIDHHSLPDGYDMAAETPSTAIIINNQLSPSYSNKSLCGAGMTYKFCEVLDDILGINNAVSYLDLSALGEIADVMSRATSETNYIITQGLKNVKNQCFAALIESNEYSLKEKALYPYPDLNAIDIAFYIAPMINAIVRVGSYEEKKNLFYAFVEPQRSVKSTKRGATEFEHENVITQVLRTGQNAKNRQNKIKEHAIDLIDYKIMKDGLDQNNVIIIEIDDSDDIPQEMTGLIAMAVVSKYGKPCMIGRRNSRGELQGSIRSNSNFEGLPSFKKFLEDSNLMMYVAGHNSAAGFGIKETSLNSLLNYANSQLNADDFKNCYQVDYVFDAEESAISTVGTIIAKNEQCFGNGIEEVTAVIKNVPLSLIYIMGKERNCIKISHNNVDYVRFKDEDFIQQVAEHRRGTVNLYVKFNLNTFCGRTSLQCFINDYEFVAEDRFAF